MTEPMPAAITGWYRTENGWTANPEMAVRRPVEHDGKNLEESLPNPMDVAHTQGIRSSSPAEQTEARHLIEGEEAMTATTTTETTNRVVKAGGNKGQAIVELLTKEPGLTRAQLAEKVGATVGRVGEVVRFLRDHGSKDEQAVIKAHLEAQPARKAPAKKAETKPAAKKAPAKKATKSTPTKAAAKKPAARKPRAKKSTESTPQG